MGISLEKGQYCNLIYLDFSVGRVLDYLQEVVCVLPFYYWVWLFFFFQAEDGIRDHCVTGVQTCALPICGRSDVLSALADYAAAEAELRLQIAKQYPDIHLSPGYQYDQGDNKWMLGIVLELPAFNQNQGPIAEARARRDEAATRFTEVQAKVISEIDRAGVAYRAAREQLTTTDALLAATQQQQQSAEAQLRAGAADPLDRLTAEFELGVAALAKLDARTAMQQSIGALEDALQQPIDSTGPTSSPAALLNTAQNPPERSAK